MNPERTRRLVYHALQRVGYGEPLPTYGIHKLLYRLSRDHPHLFGDDLPYFWYEHGPFSEPAQEATEALARSGALQASRSPYGAQYSIVHGNAPAGDLTADELNALLATMKKFGNTPAHKLRDDIYWQDAPYPFMPLMKIQLWPQLEVLAHELSVGRETLTAKGRRAADEAPGLLARCEGRLPTEPLFDEFVEVFSLYRTAVDRLLGHALRAPGPESAAKVSMAYSKTQEVWKVFAHGARVIHHDAYYDPQVPRWEIQYRREIATLHQEIDRFYDTVAATNLTEPKWESPHTHILSTAFQPDSDN